MRLFLLNLGTVSLQTRNILQKSLNEILNPLSANPTKWSNTLKQFVGNFPTNCLSVFDHFVRLAVKGLTVVCYRLFSKVKIDYVIIFALKTLFPRFSHQVWFTSFIVDYAMNYEKCVGHVAVRSSEHIGISPLSNERVQPRKDSAVYHHLLNCNYSPSFEDVSVLCHENKKCLLEPKESLLIWRDRPTMNRNILSALLYPFE